MTSRFLGAFLLLLALSPASAFADTSSSLDAINDGLTSSVNRMVSFVSHLMASTPHTAVATGLTTTALRATAAAVVDDLAHIPDQFASLFFGLADTIAQGIPATDLAASAATPTTAPAASSASAPPAATASITAAPPATSPPHRSAVSNRHQAPQVPSAVSQAIIVQQIAPQKNSDTVSPATLATLLANLRSELLSRISSVPAQSGGGPAVPSYANTFGLSQRIDSLTNTAINTPTVTNPSISGGSISGATVSGYLPLTGGTLSGALNGTNLTLTGNLTVAGAQTLSGAITVPYVNATSTSVDSAFVRLTATNATTTNATSTTFFSTLGRFTTGIIDTLSAAVATITNLTTTNLTAVNATTTNATSTNLYAASAVTGNFTTTGTASSSALVASNSFTFQNVTGFLKATAGAVATSLINLASDVTGILPVVNGGTGWDTIAASAIPYGNGSGALATTTAGTAGHVLAYLNGIPTWTATTTFSSPLVYTGGAVSISAADGSTNGYLASSDWTNFNNKIASSSLATSALLRGLLSDPTGTGSAVFATSPTFGGTPIFGGGAVNYSIDSTSTVPNNSPYAWTIATSTTGTPLLRVDTTSGSESISFGSTGSDVIIGDVGEPSNLVFQEDSTIKGAGSGRTITIGANSDVINFGVNVGIGTTSPSTTFGLVGSHYLTGGLGVGVLNTTAGTLQTSGAAAIGGTLTQTGLATLTNGFLSNASSTVTSGLFSMNGGASTTNITASGAGYFGTASTTNLTVSSIQSALHLSDATGVTSAYAGSTCTNQFVRSLNGAGVATCASVSLSADVTGILPIANGGTATSTQVTDGVNFFDGTRITSGTAMVFAGSKLGIGTTTPAKPLDVNGSAQFEGSSANLYVNPYGASGDSGSIQFANNRASFGYNSSASGNAYIFAGSGRGIDFLPNAGAAANQARLTGTGNLGIATTTPWARLSIAGPAGGTAPLFAISSSTAGFATSTAFLVDQNGNVGIGTTSPTTALQVNGVVTPNADNTSTLGNSTYRWSAVYAANGVIQTSDQRLKTNVTDLNYGLADILKLRAVSYTWTAHPEQGTKLGFIAQEVQPVMPEVVTVGDDAAHSLGLNYTEFIPAIVKAIQDIANVAGVFKANLIAYFANSANGIGDFFATHIHANDVHAGQFCGKKSDGSEVCVTGDQLAAVLAAAGQQAASDTPLSTATSSISVASSTPVLLTSPVIQINGNNPAIIHLGDAYADLSATIVSPDADKNLGILTFLNGIKIDAIQLDTSTTSTSTIDYVVTDQFDTTATATRTVIVEPVLP